MPRHIDPMPPLKYKRRACSQCGAKTQRQAEKVCKQTQGIDGDYHCAGEFDSTGWSVQPTDDSIKAMDNWCDREAKRQGW